MHMRKLLMASVMTLGVLGMSMPSNAADVTWPTTPRDAKTFVQNMPSTGWTRIMLASLNLKFLIGKPIVAVMNPTDEEIVSIICDGKWSLVGENAYNKNKGAPGAVAPHSIVLIPTDGFDGYCKQSIYALTESGQRINGFLNAESFSDATVIYFGQK